MHRLLSAAAAALMAALPARADAQQTGGTDDTRPASPDQHAKTEGHWDPHHVEKSERKTAQPAGKRVTPSKSELHRKSETRADGSTKTEEERSDVRETARGEVKNESKIVSETQPNARGGTTTTRDVTRSHDEP